MYPWAPVLSVRRRLLGIHLATPRARVRSRHAARAAMVRACANRPAGCRDNRNRPATNCGRSGSVNNFRGGSKPASCKPSRNPGRRHTTSDQGTRSGSARYVHACPLVVLIRPPIELHRVVVPATTSRRGRGRRRYHSFSVRSSARGLATSRPVGDQVLTWFGLVQCVPRERQPPIVAL